MTQIEIILVNSKTTFSNTLIGYFMSTTIIMGEVLKSLKKYEQT